MSLRIAAISVLLAACALAQEVKVGLELPKDAVKRGETFDAVVRFEVKPGFHIYGPEETGGLPTKVELADAKGFQAGKARYPAPKQEDFPAQGGKVAVYEGSVEVRLPVTVAADAEEGEHEIAVKVDYMACTASTCKLPVRGEEVKGKVVVKGAAEGTSGAAQAPTPPPAESAPPVPGGQAPPAPSGAFGKALQKGLLTTLLVAFLAGLAADLTPCVFPVIPVTIGYFGTQGKGSWAGKLAMGFAYFLGIVLFYALIGFAVALLSVNIAQAMANPWVVAVLGLFFLALALNMFGLFEIALPYWLTGGITEKQRTGFGGAFVLGGVMSLVAFPCVGPFIGGLIPYVAAKGDKLVSLAAFVAFGVGLGGPFLLLSIFAGSLTSLPRAGEWMARVKVFFGFVMLGMILYFARVFLSDTTLLLLAGALAVFQGTFCGAFTPLTRESGPGALFGKALGVLIAASGLVAFVLGLVGDRLPSAAPAARKAEIEWRTGFDEAKKVALAQKKPMIVDFTADT